MQISAGQSPEHQFSIRSLMDLPHHVQFDTALRYVDNLPDLNVPSYFSLDVRLAWRVNKHLEVSVVGQDLVDAHHLEFIPGLATQKTEVPRSVYGKITWSY